MSENSQNGAEKASWVPPSVKRAALGIAAALGIGSAVAHEVKNYDPEESEEISRRMDDDYNSGRIEGVPAPEADLLFSGERARMSEEEIRSHRNEITRDVKRERMNDALAEANITCDQEFNLEVRDRLLGMQKTLAEGGIKLARVSLTRQAVEKEVGTEREKVMAFLSVRSTEDGRSTTEISVTGWNDEIQEQTKELIDAAEKQILAGG
jgi:hypothetical protein